MTAWPDTASTHTASSVASLRQAHIINLSTGLEFLPEIEPDGNCRFQSSHLESKAWQQFLDSADASLLYMLATGTHVVLYDCGSRRSDGCPRTIWQGVPYLIYVLTRSWRLPAPTAWVNGHNVTSYFDSLYPQLDR